MQSRSRPPHRAWFGPGTDHDCRLYPVSFRAEGRLTKRLQAVMLREKAELRTQAQHVTRKTRQFASRGAIREENAALWRIGGLGGGLAYVASAPQSKHNYPSLLL